MMESRVNRQWILSSRPHGMFSGQELTLREVPVPAPADGEVLVRNLVCSCEPAQLAWMTADTYLPAVAIGEPMRALSAGKVVASGHPAYKEGQLVQGLFGWQDYALTRSDGPYPILSAAADVPIEHALSALGNTGMTAYFGMFEVGRPRSGDTVVVSAAAGATGSIAAQLAKEHGCRVIGIAGGTKKCSYLRDELGLDAAIDYKSENIITRLRQTCPNGIDVYFDNVGGKLLDAVLLFVAVHARIVLCGAISTYADTTPSPGPKNYLRLLQKRARMEGFNMIDYLDRAEAAQAALHALFRAGKLKERLDVVLGLERAPEALKRVFSGENQGKQLVRIA